MSAIRPAVTSAGGLVGLAVAAPAVNILQHDDEGTNIITGVRLRTITRKTAKRFIGTTIHQLDRRGKAYQDDSLNYFSMLDNT
jgi:hypothetical protein